MKKIDIVTRLEEINGLNAKEKTEALANFIEEMRPKTASDGVKKVKMIRICNVELEKNVKIPRQMEVLYNYLCDLKDESAEISLHDLKEKIDADETLVSNLQTKQSAWLIYNFYQKRLEDYGMIERFSVEAAA